MPDTERYEAALKEHGPALERLSRAYEADPERRKDLHQDMLAALWTALPSFENRSSLRTWVFRIGHNTAVSHIVRSRARTPLHSIEELGELEPAVATDLDAELDRHASLATLEKLLHELKPADRALMLLYLEELSASEISEVTGLSVSNVSVKVHRIKALLAKRFASGGSP